jgi:glycosyltransferase involved in cell wall biosynthesis
MNKKERIFYDATFQILSPKRGMATYLNNLLEAFALGGEQVTGIASSGLVNSQKENVIYVGLKNFVLWEQFSIPAFIKKNRVKLFVFPYNTGPVYFAIKCKSVLILHDLIFMEPFSKIPLSSNLKQIIGRFYRITIGPRMVKKTDLIITVSEYSKKKIIEKFNIKADKITVIPNSIDVSCEKQATPENLTRDFFLDVGGDAPHKNTAFLIRGYSMLPQEIKNRYSLKIVGVTNLSNKKELIRLIESVGEERNISVEKFLEDEQLIELYQKSFLFIFPSLIEGFGIPLLEAMKFDCTIVCSNTSSMPEVCDEAAFYFDPTDLQSFVVAITYACNNTELRQSKRQHAIKQLNYYSRENFNRKALDWLKKNF